MPPIESRISDLLQLKTHPDISNILDGISEFVMSKGRDVSTHQVRRIYNEVKKLILLITYLTFLSNIWFVPTF